MILSNKRMTKVLIRLHECAGWSVSLLFANTEDGFSRTEAQIVMIACITNNAIEHVSSR